VDATTAPSLPATPTTAAATHQTLRLRLGCLLLPQLLHRCLPLGLGCLHLLLARHDLSLLLLQNGRRLLLKLRLLLLALLLLHASLRRVDVTARAATAPAAVSHEEHQR
jgi:hypothetical protein